MSSGAEGLPPAAVIFGCAGHTAGPDEIAFFAEADPLGFILFKRNCGDPDQVRALVRSLRDSVGRPDAPVLIDQEGGRVARLGPPHWIARPAARAFGRLAERDGVDRAVEIARLNARSIAGELADLGISVDCLPLLDVAVEGAHDVIGDRAFGSDPTVIAALGRAVCEGLLAGRVIPVIKHLPGHGRAGADSHVELPVVEASAEELERTDLAPFRALNDAPWAMTAHVVYRAFDAGRPATVSPRVIDTVIRGAIGFQGLLISDDLCMEALAGTPARRARAALNAGCDVLLHCNGALQDMRDMMDGIEPLSGMALDRLAAATARLGPPATVDAGALARIVDAGALARIVDAGALARRRCPGRALDGADGHCLYRIDLAASGPDRDYPARGRPWLRRVAAGR